MMFPSYRRKKTETAMDLFTGNHYFNPHLLVNNPFKK